MQSTNLRVIETQINPRYTAKNNTIELNVDYNITPSLTFTSQTGYNQDFLWSTEDYNRFNTTPDIFNVNGLHPARSDHDQSRRQLPLQRRYAQHRRPQSCPVPNGRGNQATGSFCDPQLGCSTRLVVQDVSDEHAWQISQEFRLASNFTGPLNFSIGGNYMHYETVEDYYVFANTLTMFAAVVGTGHCDRSLDAGRHRQFAMLHERPCCWPTLRDRQQYSTFDRPAVRTMHLHRSQSAGQAEQSWPQLFPQPESLRAQFLCRIRRGLLQRHARSEADRRLALDRRPEALP